MTPLSLQKRKVGIIGAGLGGLSAAVTLAHAGFQVTVIEKNEGPGGKMGHLEKEGYSWDTGPSVLTMPETLNGLFQRVDHRMEDFLTLVPLKDDFRCRWDDGTMLDENEAFWARPDVSKYLQHGRGLYEVATELFLLNDLGHFWGSLRPKDLAKLKYLPRLLDPRCMHRSLRSFFKDEHMVQLFSRYALWTGSSPYLAPCLHNLIPYVRAKHGIWYVKGGLYQIASALYKLARRFSVEFRFNTSITGAKQLPNGHALATDGVWDRFDYVVCNKDALSAYQTLVSREQAARFKRDFLKKRPVSASAYVLFLGLKTRYEGVKHHNVFFSSDYRKEFEDVFVNRVPVDDPTVYVCAASRTEPERAPAGCDSWYVSVAAPPLGRRTAWSEIGDSYAERVIDRLVRIGFTDIRKQIAVKQWISPSQLRSQFSAHAGALHGFASHSLLASLNRPPMQAYDMKTLLFVGGSTHPGGGIPLVLLGGQMAARNIIDAARSE